MSHIIQKSSGPGKHIKRVVYGLGPMIIEIKISMGPDWVSWGQGGPTLAHQTLTLTRVGGTSGNFYYFPVFQCNYSLKFHVMHKCNAIEMFV